MTEVYIPKEKEIKMSKHQKILDKQLVFMSRLGILNMVIFTIGLVLLIIGTEITQESKNFQIFTWNVIFSISGYVGIFFFFASASAMLVIQKKIRVVKWEILTFLRLHDDNR